MKTLEELKKELLKDGIIDKDEVLMLEKRLFEDGKIDSDEAEWLYNKIKGDGTIDETEKELLLTLKSRAKMFPSRLEELL